MPVQERHAEYDHGGDERIAGREAPAVDPLAVEGLVARSALRARIWIGETETAAGQRCSRQPCRGRRRRRQLGRLRRGRNH
jgi:hypothetical protein